MEFLTVLPQMEVLSWITITFFVIGNGFLFLCIYRNWQKSEEIKPELSEKEKQYIKFIEHSGYPVKRERFIYLHSEVIRACFNIWMKGYVTFEDWMHIYNWIFYFENRKEFKSTCDLMFDNLQLCNKLFKYHRDNKMIFPSDKFFQVFFGFGEYYEQVLNENKK